MAIDILHQNNQDTARTTADRERRLYTIFAKGAVSVEDFKGGFEAMLTDMKQHQYNKVIINIKEVSSTPIVARTWLLTTFVPEMYRTVQNVQVGLINTTAFFEGTTISLLVTSIQTLGFNLGIKFYKSVDEAEKALLG